MLLAILPASAQPFPAKPVRIIAPFPPGGSVDVFARILAPKLSESLGQQIIIDNRSGASGNIGTELAARAAPDGYTLLANTLPFVTNSFLYSRMPYDAVKDFTPLSVLAASPAVLAVHPSVPVRTVRELIQLAKTKTGTLNYASSGAGTNHHIAGELLNYLARIEITAIHYKGGGPAAIANLAGEVGINWPNVVAVVPYVKAGRIRALGVTSPRRSAAMPEVPTIAEAGVPGYDFTPWQMMLAPAGTPAAVVTLLNSHLVKAMQAPDIAERMARDGADVIASSQPEAVKHVQSEMEKWRRVIKERGMRAE
ncbi:MAG TPA: tripartite tricarboxylate transporter substrate binding protein [Burkholderiales bacterium]|nr:tripartite tricarboxylate transporter substrate binding protein [Burkholderiales bacterium]